MPRRNRRAPASHPFADPGQPLIDEDPESLAKKQLPLLLNPHAPDFPVPHRELVRFLKWFGKPSSMLFDDLVIDPDNRGAEQLIKAEFEQILLGFTELQFEFHAAGVRGDCCLA
jgi:hypothetical protein